MILQRKIVVTRRDRMGAVLEHAGASTESGLSVLTHTDRICSEGGVVFPRDNSGGRYRTRTDDLFRVKEARYQLRQSPVCCITAKPTSTMLHDFRSSRCHANVREYV